MSRLRAKKPDPVTKRLKLFMFGGAGAGKTFASIAFPGAYIIDCERGTEQYHEQIIANGGVVLATTNYDDIVAEVKALLTEKHDYRTFVIDPITTVWNELLDKWELKVGSDFGRHRAPANRDMKRLYNLLMQLDMNVVITAHAKKEYAQGSKVMQVIGETFDAWPSIDYAFDLVLYIQKQKGKKTRIAVPVKSRLAGFPEDEVFEWGFDAVKARYDATMLEKAAAPVALAAPEQVAEIKRLLEIVRLPDGTTEKWMAKAAVDDWEDFPSDTLARCIEYVKGRLPTAVAAA